MINKLSVKNFRCFDSLELSKLTRVNILTGSNAAGKSALLEALYLGVVASVQAVLNISVLRGTQHALMVALGAGPGSAVLVPPFSGAPSTALSSLFDPLFRVVADEGTTAAGGDIRIETSDTDSRHFLLEVSRSARGTEPVPVVAGPAGTFGAPVVTFHRRVSYPGGAGPDQSVAVTVGPNGQIQQPQLEPFGQATLIFGPDTRYTETDDILWFSQLKERGGGELDNLVSFLQSQFDFIEGLEVLAPTGSSGLYARMKDGTARRLSAVSSGIYKIVSILLACARMRGGIILIDEIENGVFYKKYAPLWSVLYGFTERTGNQLFVTTHSAECLRAAPIAEHVGEFSLIQLFREGGATKALTVAGADAAAAINADIEVRV